MNVDCLSHFGDFLLFRVHRRGLDGAGSYSRQGSRVFVIFYTRDKGQRVTGNGQRVTGGRQQNKKEKNPNQIEDRKDEEEKK